MANEENGNVFAQSLQSLSPKTMIVQTAVPHRSRGEKVSLLFRVGVILLCLSVLVYCLFSVVQNMLDYAKAQDYYDRLVDEIWNYEGDLTENPYGGVVYSEKDYLHDATADYDQAQKDTGLVVETPEWFSDEMSKIRAKLGALYAQNNDLIAWITIPDTVINYPVVLTDNNEYYLNHSFQKDFLIAGTIFADYRNSADLMSNYNTILYGHNVNSGNMFSILSKYFSKSFYKAHPDIYLYTMDGIYRYTVFNVSKVSSSDNYIRTYFESSDDFIAFAEEKAESSVYSTKGLQFTGDDRILTLSTCTNAHDPSERYCIQAKLVEIQK